VFAIATATHKRNPQEARDRNDNGNDATMIVAMIVAMIRNDNDSDNGAGFNKDA